MSSFPPFTTTLDKTQYLLNSLIPVAMGSMVITPPTSATVSVTGTGGVTLTPPTNYVQVTSYTGTSFTQTNTPMFSVVSGKLVFSGLDPSRKYIMMVNGYMNCTHSANNTVVGVVFTLTKSGVTTYTPRIVKSKLPNSGDPGNLAGNGIIGSKSSGVYLVNGDSFGVAVASSVTGTITISSSNISFTLYALVE